VPPFILGLFLLSIFYVGLGWFAPGRTAITELSLRTYTEFSHYTGFLTIDGLLNGRPDVTLDALRHLVLPVFALVLAHWAVLGRVTRASMIEVRDQDYVTAAHARGLRPRTVIWVHAFRNTLLPGLTSSALSVASLITGVFIIEVIFNIHGLSELMVQGMSDIPDAALALGLAIYTALLVMPIMLILDVVKALVDPRVRAGVMA
jgi:peptide/nickel transport system permease protein